MTINEIKKLLELNPSEELLAALRQDKRVGVQKLVAAYEKRQKKEMQERKRYEALWHYENLYLSRPGVEWVLGMDEAGRGPLAGPLVIAGVILPPDVYLPGLNDSKKLTEAKREALYPEIVRQAVAVMVNVVSVANIDRLNIYQATKKGMEAILNRISVRPQVALVDAMEPRARGVETVSIIHGDALSASIAAASVVAKVVRDRLMKDLSVFYPEYGLESNKGYGSQQHIDAIAKFGATRIHRRSYEPIRSMNLPPVERREDYLFEPEDGVEDEGLMAVLADLAKDARI